MQAPHPSTSPQLSGTEKQIAWAENIRAGFAAAYKTTLEELRNHVNHEYDDAPAENRAAVMAIVQSHVDAIMGRTSAAEWIDGRGFEHEASVPAGTPRAQNNALNLLIEVRQKNNRTIRALLA